MQVKHTEASMLVEHIMVNMLVKHIMVKMLVIDIRVKMIVVDIKVKIQFELIVDNKLVNFIEVRLQQLKVVEFVKYCLLKALKFFEEQLVSLVVVSLSTLQQHRLLLLAILIFLSFQQQASLSLQQPPF